MFEALVGEAWRGGGKAPEVKGTRQSVLREAVDRGRRLQLVKTYKTSRWHRLVEQIEVEGSNPSRPTTEGPPHLGAGGVATQVATSD
jgi:hypothetical protein